MVKATLIKASGMNRSHLIIVVLLMLLTGAAYSLEPVSPEGLWKTFDDDGQISGYVRIVKDHDIYTGVIEKGVIEKSVAGKGLASNQEEYCTACKDERKNQKLIGMTIIKNVTAHGESYDGDEILDPFSGNTYHVKLKLKGAGKQLEVRGFIGFSLFGRTQIWQREPHA